MTTLLHIARCAAALGAAVGYLLTFAAVADAEPLIRLTGVVRSARVEADKIVLKVATPVSTITAHVSPHGIDSRHLADSAVRLAGVWTAGTPGPREPMTQIFAVTSLDIVTRGPRDPFDAPELSLQEVLHLSGREVPLHRVRIAGTVTAQFGGQSVYVSDGRHDIRLQTADAVSFKPGDVITLAGYISRSASPRELVETIVRKTDAVAAPVPIRIDSAGLLKTEHHNMLVRLEATVIRLSVDAHDQDLMLESDGMMFEGELENQDDPVLPTLIPGSRVEVTGIAHVATATSDDPGSLRILLREAADVRVLSRPTWWTVQRALYLLGVMIVGFVAAGGWIVALRRRFPVVERARIESERRYRELFDHAPAGHFVSDGNGTLTACNDAFARLVGFKSADAAIGASADSFHARDEDRGAWRELLHDGTPLQNRKVALRAVDGRVIHALETAVVQTDGHRSVAPRARRPAAAGAEDGSDRPSCGRGRA
jgi:PAS domain S-box-containing protein